MYCSAGASLQRRWCSLRCDGAACSHRFQAVPQIFSSFNPNRFYSFSCRYGLEGAPAALVADLGRLLEMKAAAEIEDTASPLQFCAVAFEERVAELEVAVAQATEAQLAAKRRAMAAENEVEKSRESLADALLEGVRWATAAEEQRRAAARAEVRLQEVQAQLHGRDPRRDPAGGGSPTHRRRPGPCSPRMRRCEFIAAAWGPAHVRLLT